MSVISLTMHRIVQVNIGTGMRPEYKHAERPAIVCAQVSGIYERDPSQEVHLKASRNQGCEACAHNDWHSAVWTDDTELWERHPARCNVAYQP